MCARAFCFFQASLLLLLLRICRFCWFWVATSRHHKEFFQQKLSTLALFTTSSFASLLIQSVAEEEEEKGWLNKLCHTNAGCSSNLLEANTKIKVDNHSISSDGIFWILSMAGAACWMEISLVTTDNTTLEKDHECSRGCLSKVIKRIRFVLCVSIKCRRVS